MLQLFLEITGNLLTVTFSVQSALKLLYCGITWTTQNFILEPRAREGSSTTACRGRHEVEISSVVALSSTGNYTCSSSREIVLAC